jgi:DUF1009 family protein
MGKRIGILAGAGRFVPAAIADLRKRGHDCVVAAIEGEASPRLARAGEKFRWFSLARPGAAAAYLRENGVAGILMLGKVRPSTVYGLENSDPSLLAGLSDRSATAILRAAVAFLESQGLRVLDPVPFLKAYLCPPGTLTRTEPPPAVLEDIDFGLPLARRLADLEIGQTVIVRRKAVVAVEGMEGTDLTIRRAARIAGGGFSVAKAGRTRQDMRLDLPAVGLDTVRAVVRAGGAAIGLDAGRVAFFQRSEAIALAEAHGVAITARPITAEKEVTVG